MKKRIITDIKTQKNGIIILLEKEEYLLSFDQYSNGFYYPYKTLTEEEYKTLVYDAKTKKANDYLRYLLSTSRYSEARLTSKIKEKTNLSNSDIKKLLVPYLENKQIDDESYAIDFATSKLEKGYGFNYIVSKLKQKGIPDKILKSQVFLDLFQKESYDLTSLIEKADRSKKSKTIEIRKVEILQFFIRRGFSPIEAKKAIDSYYASLDSHEREKEEENRIVLLEKEYQKWYNFVVRKFDDKKKQKDALIRKLLSKGFRYDEILEKLEEDSTHD